MSDVSAHVGIAPENAERDYWNTHATPIDVWGEEGAHAWMVGVIEQCRRIRRALYTEPWMDGRFLDLGCGLGRLTIPMALHAVSSDMEFVGVDSSPAMVEKARLVALVALASPTPPMTTRVLSFDVCHGRTLPYDDASFDGVWSVLLFQHIPPYAQGQYVREVARVLRPGGRFLVQIDADDRTHGEFLHWHTSIEDMEREASKVGLRLVKGEEDDSYPTWCWLTFEKEMT